MDTNKTQPIFAEGISFFRPKEGSPEWIKGKVTIHPQRLIKFLTENKQYLSEKGFLNLDLKVSKDKASLYFQVNTWKPEKKVEELPTMTSKGYNGEQFSVDDIPFN
jgi:hypothetical protein